MFVEYFTLLGLHAQLSSYPRGVIVTLSLHTGTWARTPGILLMHRDIVLMAAPTLQEEYTLTVRP